MEPCELDKKTEKARKWFEIWWGIFGQDFEERIGWGITKKEMASYAFEGGFIAGYNRAKYHEHEAE